MAGSAFKLVSRLPQMTDALQSKAVALVKATALEIKADAQESMAGAKSGKRYGKHQASAPGEPPAIDLGTLVKSGYVRTVPRAITSYFGFTAEYAMHLEFGTKRMAPRPFLRPAILRAKPGFEAGLRKLLE